ncbi:MAG: hypothetical protein K0U86_22195 [Planctomycetes bacterium]|nr:hypothetical protein [Planctomycetota bacterium]MCH9727620.1 hypothetical protein [Planctomycetota bacterium]MCH9777400.1 hypothetical protein [Planctomycetota bacterium]MCH9791264.1 hypothetical protein [Planctomycetota bacterium]MDF1742739.1 hypothetical protein [Gimesia sp.]
MFKRFTFIRSCLLAIVMLGLMSAPSAINEAAACPMCKQLNDTDDNKPRAYMYSITFMLTMPAIIFSCFGVAFYRMNRREQATLLENENSRDPHTNDADSGLNE